MKRVLVAGRLHDDGVAHLLQRSDVEAEFLEAPSCEEVAARLPDADALVVRTVLVTAEAIDSAPKLRVISRHGVGYDNIDVAALTRRRIPLTVVGDVNAVTVAEHAIAAMLALAKCLGRHDAAVRSGDWKLREAFASRELWRKTLLIVGFGRIGRELAARARAFDMKVVVYDPYVDADTVRASSYHSATDLIAALGDADYVSLHLPVGPQTKNIIGADALAGMRPSAFLVNTARGGLVDEDALDAALTEGQIAGAAIDVFADEPPQAGHALLQNDRVLLSPHIAGLTEECARRMAIVCVDNALAALDGTLDPKMVVNKEVLAV